MTARHSYRKPPAHILLALVSSHLLQQKQLEQCSDSSGPAVMATRLNCKSTIFREGSGEDLAAKVRVADEAIARARAEQQAASDRLAREVRFNSVMQEGQADQVTQSVLHTGLPCTEGSSQAPLMHC